MDGGQKLAIQDCYARMYYANVASSRDDCFLHYTTGLHFLTCSCQTEPDFIEIPLKGYKHKK